MGLAFHLLLDIQRVIRVNEIHERIVCVQFGKGGDLRENHSPHEPVKILGDFYSAWFTLAADALPITDKKSP